MIAILGCNPPNAAVILAADWRTFSTWVVSSLMAADWAGIERRTSSAAERAPAFRHCRAPGFYYQQGMKSTWEGLYAPTDDASAAEARSGHKAPPTLLTLFA